MFQLLITQPQPVGHMSAQARIVVFSLGLALCTWVLLKVRKRSVLVPISTLFLVIGLGTIGFSLYPDGFDQLSYILGIHYPPIFYFVLAILALILVILYIATRLSIVDERCRRLAQELALIRSSGPPDGDRLGQDDNL